MPMSWIRNSNIWSRHLSAIGGNPAIIRYSRKTKEQYVQTEIEGKATGWKAFYQDGRWVEEQKVSKKAKSSA
ncbi:MAG: hypothetical protein CM15mP120_03540 [Pseudomonadota bacterium]|nr:MAG: hypothetical protein CM15mP120_03540 [Pseudomonadota bacterium]